jgi:ADP-ribosylation factor-like protein 8
MDVARHELIDLISKPALAGIPLLVLGNKNDIEGAANVEDLITKLQLKDIQGREVCCYSVSAKNQVNLDADLAGQFLWLCSGRSQHYWSAIYFLFLIFRR